MRTSVKRALVIGSAVAVAGVATGIAYAAWTVNGSGNGYVKAASAQALSTVDVSASASGTLYPGGTADVVLKIHNPNKFPVLVTSVSGAGAATGSGGTGACTTTGVSFVDQANVSITVAANGDATATLTNAASMSNASDDGCQGATFAIPVTFTGTSAASN